MVEQAEEPVVDEQIQIEMLNEAAEIGDREEGGWWQILGTPKLMVQLTLGTLVMKNSRANNQWILKFH